MKTHEALVWLLFGTTCTACDASAPVNNHAAPLANVTPSARVLIAQVTGPTELLESRSADYRRGYEEGMALAEGEFARGEATIYVYGMLPFGEKLDRDTGLLLAEIAGCMVGDVIIGRADGHNERIDALIGQRGLPAYSRKKWEDEIFGISKFFSTRTSTEIQSLHIGGDDVNLGAGHIRLSPRRNGLRVFVDGVELKRRYDSGQETPIVDPMLGEVPRQTDVALGPDGSDTLFFHWSISGGVQRYGVLDLRNGQWLRRADN